MPPDDLSATFENIIPAHVRRQAQRAEELVAQQSAPETPPEGEGGTPEVGAGTTTVGNEPAPPAASTPPATPPAPPAPEDWEQRFRTIKGKYDAEVPVLHGELRALRRQIEVMQETLARPPQPAPAMPEPPAPARVPDADIEAYGEELVSGARRWARAELAPEFDALRAQLAEQQRRLEQLNGQTNTVAASAFERGLDVQVPEWRTVNLDPSFVAWLAQVDPFSGQTRQSLVNAAANAHDVARTAVFFRAYLNEQTALQPPATSSQTAPAAAPPVSLESLAAPGRASAPASTGAPAEKRIWTNAQIATFYRDVNAGRYRGRDAQRAQLEADLIAAASDGRLRN